MLRYWQEQTINSFDSAYFLVQELKRGLGGLRSVGFKLLETGQVSAWGFGGVVVGLSQYPPEGGSPCLDSCRTKLSTVLYHLSLFCNVFNAL